MTKSISIIFFLLYGLTNLYGQREQDLVVEFSKIDSLEYIEYRNEYSNPLVLDSTKRTIPDSSFTLTISNENQHFACQKDYAPCYYYIGFLPPLESFVITHCTMYVCGTFLINQNSGERHNLFSPFDNECEPPLLSKGQNKMLVFASNVFQTESFISIYQRKDKLANFDFDSFESLTTDKWKIYEAVWIDETSFPLKTFEEYGAQTGSVPLNVKYILGRIK